MDVPELSQISLDSVAVHNALKSLVGSKSAGPDEIHPQMLKILAPVIALPVLDLFETSLRQGYSLRIGSAPRLCLSTKVAAQLTPRTTDRSALPVYSAKYLRG